MSETGRICDSCGVLFDIDEGSWVGEMFVCKDYSKKKGRCLKMSEKNDKEKLFELYDLEQEYLSEIGHLEELIEERKGLLKKLQSKIHMMDEKNGKKLRIPSELYKQLKRMLEDETYTSPEDVVREACRRIKEPGTSRLSHEDILRSIHTFEGIGKASEKERKAWKKILELMDKEMEERR